MGRIGEEEMKRRERRFRGRRFYERAVGGNWWLVSIMPRVVKTWPRALTARGYKNAAEKPAPTSRR